MAERLLGELLRRTEVEEWPSADQIDLSPIIGIADGPPDLSERHHHYLDPDAT